MEAWAWRERLQRAIDGCHTTDEMNVVAEAAYEELPGPNVPPTCGYQVCTGPAAVPLMASTSQFRGQLTNMATTSCVILTASNNAGLLSAATGWHLALAWGHVSEVPSCPCLWLAGLHQW